MENFYPFPLQFERASVSELTVFLTLVCFCIVIYVLSLSGYIRNAFLAFRLPGPKALPFIGNCLVVKEKDRECTFNVENFENVFKFPSSSLSNSLLITAFINSFTSVNIDAFHYRPSYFYTLGACYDESSLFVGFYHATVDPAASKA